MKWRPRACCNRGGVERVLPVVGTQHKEILTSEYFAPEPVDAIVDLDSVDYEASASPAITELDTDSDGVVDAVLTDIDGDLSYDVAEFDNVADGEFVPDVVAVDADADGIADVLFVDVDVDGRFDTISCNIGTEVADANLYQT